MEFNKKELKVDMLKLAFDLEKQYSDLNFKHHCYLRIAYDNTIGQKWNDIIKSPFLNNCDINHLIDVYLLLTFYLTNQQLLETHNQNSLNYRKK